VHKKSWSVNCGIF